MKCVKCFQEIPDGSKFCPLCGGEQPESAAASSVNTAAENTAEENTAAPQQDYQTNESAQQTYQSYESAQQTYQSYGSAPQQDYQSYQTYSQPEKPINWVPYLVLSIITTLCCCLPFGIAGIVFSAKINGAMNAGDYEGAKKAAKMAKIWIIVSAALGLVVEIIYILLVVVGIAGAGTAGYYYY